MRMRSPLRARLLAGAFLLRRSPGSPVPARPPSRSASPPKEADGACPAAAERSGDRSRGRGVRPRLGSIAAASSNCASKDSPTPRSTKPQPGWRTARGAAGTILALPDGRNRAVRLCRQAFSVGGPLRVRRRPDRSRQCARARARGRRRARPPTSTRSWCGRGRPCPRRAPRGCGFWPPLRRTRTPVAAALAALAEFPRASLVAVGCGRRTSDRRGHGRALAAAEIPDRGRLPRPDHDDADPKRRFQRAGPAVLRREGLHADPAPRKRSLPATRGSTSRARRTTARASRTWPAA